MYCHFLLLSRVYQRSRKYWLMADGQEEPLNPKVHALNAYKMFYSYKHQRSNKADPTLSAGSYYRVYSITAWCASQHRIHCNEPHCERWWAELLCSSTEDRQSVALGNQRVQERAVVGRS